MVWSQSPCIISCMIFEEKCLLGLCFFYFVRYYKYTSVVIVCFPGCDVLNFEIIRRFLVRLFLDMTKKFVKYQERKELLG